jgi:alkylated DNA repair dioxygenase AlkB
MYPHFEEQRLDERHVFFCGRLPDALVPDDVGFESLWSIHPDEYHEIKIHGRLVKTPRWQQAYGRDYHYTGRTNAALPVPDNLTPFLQWAHKAVDPRLNGILLNWYDGALGHYIGKHRDSRANMIGGAPIVTISLGDERVFRLRPWKSAGSLVDIAAVNGAVFIMPFETNLAWTHEVLHRARDCGRRISVTLRAFQDD